MVIGLHSLPTLCMWSGYTAGHPPPRLNWATHHFLEPMCVLCHLFSFSLSKGTAGSQEFVIDHKEERDPESFSGKHCYPKCHHTEIKSLFQNVYQCSGYSIEENLPMEKTLTELKSTLNDTVDLHSGVGFLFCHKLGTIYGRVLICGPYLT